VEKEQYFLNTLQIFPKQEEDNMAFEKLKEIYEIEVEYTTKSSLAILAGREAAFTAIDQVVTLVGGKPVIPGSSIKGAIRSTLESILSEKGERVCVPLSAIPKDFSRNPEEYAKRIGRIPPCEPRRKEPCPVCQIFGAADLAARAMFMDARPVGEPHLTDRTHVAITRDNKAAAEGKLMQVQTIDAGAQFRGIIRVVNPEPWQIGAVLVSISSLEMLGLGAKKSAGYGEIETKIISIKRKVLKDSKWETTDINQFEEFLSAFAAYRE
jgi:CRISPR-associated RAMP protein (TIGR02581 family)